MLKTVMRWAAGVTFVLAGLNHFRDPDFYLPLIPEVLGWPEFWNAFTGIAEVVGGLALLVPPLRQAAAIGLILMLLGFMWVHIDMVVHPEKSPFGADTPMWVLWSRLPFQFVLIAWVGWVGGWPWGQRKPADDDPPVRNRS
ncbi:MAG: DoxX family protein [Planctomycetota bacterium]